ncbi:hypothetical protein IFR04_009154 [Cadophora malorum]|uniref:Peroxin/Ferlin domain-containing protein n=1 Tax=Cadophora malorum TaxID=108018 RepID=A0A8H7W5B8_9HELO|nr:hypothetical protein IFR04_009154 [Cadophora malorum]
MSLLHSSTRRPSPLKDTDYDHEINLIDHTRPESPEVARSRSVGERPLSPGVASDSSSRRHSDVPLRKHTTPLHLRQQLTKKKYSKYQDRRLGEAEGSDDGEPDNEATGEIDNAQVDGGEGVVEERGRPRDSEPAKKSKRSPDSAIDILYENQRGGFLCGMPLFSASALGNLDPSPWTNSVQKTSATNITNAQVPDPSWEWAWPEWHINHTDEVDEDGWEYSFMFSKKFSWHGKTWYSSFVRRRAWTRKRVKRSAGYRVDAGHMLNSDYFTIHPAELRGSSRGSTTESQTKRYSVMSISKREMEEGIVIEEIQDIGTLLKALRLARIDREKTEAVESFIKHGGDDLYFLRDHMHEIMGMFIFQASRRLLLSHLLQIFNKASEENESVEKDQVDPAKKRRLENLEAAVKHADEEVKKLEFWSDVKDMAEKGETKGAVDESQGWDQGWSGLDNSAPKDVISDQKLPGGDDCQEGEGNGTAILNGKVNGKGKGKAKE